MSGLSTGGLVAGASPYDANAILQLLSNPDGMKASIDAYNTSRAAAESAIALAGKASQIPKLLADAEGKLASAQDVLNAAKVTASDMVAKADADAALLRGNAAQELADAKAQAASIRAEANDAVASAKAILDNATDQAGTILSSARVTSDAADAAKKDADDAMADAKSMQDRAAAAKEKYDALVKSLKAAMSE